MQFPIRNILILPILCSVYNREDTTLRVLMKYVKSSLTLISSTRRGKEPPRAIDVEHARKHFGLIVWKCTYTTFGDTNLGRKGDGRRNKMVFNQVEWACLNTTFYKLYFFIYWKNFSKVRECKRN